jgi:hypothetical protein
MLREQFDSGQGIEECVLVCPVQDWIAFCQFLIGYEMLCACERPLRADCVEEVGE